MNIVCRILNHFQLLGEKEEEENIKKKIKDCLYNSEGIFLKMIYDVKNKNLDLSEIYCAMKISHFHHIIAFYCLLEVYYNYDDETLTKEEKERDIIQLTTQTLNDFQIYKGKILEKEKHVSFFQPFFHTYIKEYLASNIITLLFGYEFN